MQPDPTLYQPLTVSSTLGPNRYLIKPHGELDRCAIDTLDEQIRGAEASTTNRIIVDLSAITFIDTAGMRTLLAAAERSRADSDRLRVIPGPDRVQRAFKMTGTENLLPLLPAAPRAGGDAG